MINKNNNRRDFLKKLAIGGGGVVALGKYHFLFANEAKNGILKSIVVDFDKCTGCRTCETACSAFHHPVEIDGELLNGLGNPKLGNIQIHHFNPDVDVASVCANCPDTPCAETGHKAIFRDEVTGAIRTNHAVCISCGSCSRACDSQRTGVIKMNPKTHHPERALSFQEVDINREYFGLSPEEIAEGLFERYYSGEEVING